MEHLSPCDIKRVVYELFGTFDEMVGGWQSSMPIKGGFVSPACM